MLTMALVGLACSRALRAEPVVGRTAAPVAADPYPLLGREGRRELMFGMRVADVRRLHPQLRVVQRPLGAVAPALPSIARYVLPNQTVPEHTKLSDIELRFWDDKLWAIIVYFPEGEAEAVGAALRVRYGRPSGASNVSTIWRGETVTLAFVPKQRWYGFTDNRLNQAVETEMAEEVERAVARQRTAAARTPSAAPAPSPTAAAMTDGGVR